MIQEDESTMPFWLGEPAPDGTRRIGLAESWLEQLGAGEIVGIDLVPPRAPLRRGDALGLLHTSTRSHDLRLPWDAEIVQINAEVKTNPTLAKLSPYGRGWVAEIKIERN